MLIEQIIEFKLRGLGPLVVFVLLQVVIFMTKQKSQRQIFKWINVYCKILHEAMSAYLTSLYITCSVARGGWQ